MVATYNGAIKRLDAAIADCGPSDTSKSDVLVRYRTWAHGRLLRTTRHTGGYWRDDIWEFVCKLSVCNRPRRVAYHLLVHVLEVPRR